MYLDSWAEMKSTIAKEKYAALRKNENVRETKKHQQFF